MPSIVPARVPGRPLSVGLQLPEVEREVRWAELLDMARAAEDVGFDALWLGDHLLYRLPDGSHRGPWEVWTLLGALAAVTSRVALGPFVACTAFHNPAVLAKMAATVDEVSGGRLVLGLGAGWNELEFRAFGLQFDHRIARFEEAFTIIRGLLQDGAVDFEGRFHEARECVLAPRGPRPGGPPLMIGSIGPRMLEITSPYVQAWNAWFDQFGNRAAGIGPLLRRVEDAERAAGRTPGSIERTCALFVQLPGGTGRIQGSPPPNPPPPVRGRPGEIAAELVGLAAAGIGHVQIVLDPINVAAIREFAAVLGALDDEGPA